MTARLGDLAHVVKSVLAAGALLVACGPGAAELAERERCYEAAEAAAQRRADRECPDLFIECHSADDILDELRRAQEACP